MEASKASILASLEPVVATLVGVLVLHESISVSAVVGIGMVLVAVVLLNIKIPPVLVRKKDSASTVKRSREMAKQHI